MRPPAAGRASTSRACQIGPEQVVDSAGLCLLGRGGAGFPAGIKWKTVRQLATVQQKYIVCNADEGDSATFADRMVMEGDPYHADRRHGDRRCRGRDPGLHLPAAANTPTRSAS